VPKIFFSDIMKIYRERLFYYKVWKCENLEVIRFHG
jgi:hypothetical protein